MINDTYVESQDLALNNNEHVHAPSKIDRIIHERRFELRDAIYLPIDSIASNMQGKLNKHGPLT
jgi:hypothetical protein